MKKDHAVLRNICWIALLAVGIAFTVYGCAPQYMREEWKTVLQKAVQICFQCIGLG